MKGVEVIHSTEAKSRRDACKGTNTDLHELGPPSFWMNDHEQLSLRNSAKDHIFKKPVMGIIESEHDKPLSTVLKKLQDFLQSSPDSKDTDSSSSNADSSDGSSVSADTSSSRSTWPDEYFLQ